MNKEDIIRMAREAGMGGMLTDVVCTHAELERFAELVRADERRACAKVCEDGVQNATDWDSSYWDQACQNRAAAIRARGNK